MRVSIFVSIDVRPVIHEGTIYGRPIILIKDSIPKKGIYVQRIHRKSKILEDLGILF